MNYHTMLRNIKKRNPTNKDLGKIFIDDRRGMTSDEIKENNTHMEEMIIHFDKYDNWYLPFDKCTWFHISMDENPVSYKSVTLTANPEKKLTSPIKFEIIADDIYVITGYMELCAADDIDRLDRVSHEGVTSRTHELGCSDFVWMPLDWYGDGIDPKYYVYVYFKEVILKHKDEDKMKIINPIVRDEMDKHLSGWPKDCETIGTMVLSAFGYFTRLIVDTKLFILEEQIATKKKGKIKQRIGSKSIFHVLDARTLRKKYIKPKKDGSTESIIRAPTERRRHERTYRHDRYVNMKGKTVIIEATWIGKSEHFDPDDDRFYRIRLDKG